MKKKTFQGRIKNSVQEILSDMANVQVGRKYESPIC